MKRVTTYRKIIEVFRLYGINLAGKRKFDHFYRDLKMDRVFVNGLVFDLELATLKELNEDEVFTLEAPAQVIRKLVEAA
ncbi:MAG: acyl carrier protein [Lunatimonas sp.]|uniref:acyl carrier protein n=1 Tax=Lunatimonas sp. TaxID=2060141 RepID=UPI00263B4E02|nr:acyl carrier protein [Lunatimonas sp.]MCC5935795.1 acyl carrier protein [Lunatimonas sp.]